MLKLFKIIFHYIKKYFAFLYSLDQKEAKILIENVPGYYTYQFGLKSRIIRFLALITVGSVYHVPWLSKLFCSYFDCTIIQQIINYETLFALYSVLLIVSIIFLLFHCIFHAVIRIIYLKKIVKNSPISIAQCVSTLLKVCKYTTVGIGLSFGVPGIDYIFKDNGHLAPAKGFFYHYRQIWAFGANPVNCAPSEGLVLKKTNPLYHVFARGQIYTQHSEQTAHSAFTEATAQKMSEDATTKYVLNALNEKSKYF